MKIGVLLCGHPADEIREKFGDYFDMFSRLLSEEDLFLVRFDVEGMAFPASVTECDGWLISGSRHGVYEDHAFIPPLEEFIRNAHAARIPMVGICFGHQIVAQALGGIAAKYKGGWSVGRVEYQTEGGGTLALNAWHQDQVITPPAMATTTASTPFCAHAVLTYPDGLLTLQPHPEIDNDALDYFLRYRGRPAGVPEDMLQAIFSAEKQPIDDRQTAAMIADHFHKYSVGAAHV